MEVLRPAATTGERIGPYEILDRAFDAPFGPVDLAYVSSGAEEGRIVLLAQVPLPTADALHARLLKTSLAARGVRHSRIVAVLEAISRPNDVVVVSEYVEAVNLRSMLRRAFVERAPLPLPVAISIATDIVRGLKAGDDAWRKIGDGSVSVYGGLIPDSVLLASFGDTMLTSVGVSSLLVNQTQLGSHVDVLAYRAPESLAGKADVRSDVYTVGVLLWEMLANRPLFGGRDRFIRTAVDAASVRREVTEAKAPRLGGVVRGGPPIPAMLIEIVHQLLARDPSARFPTLPALLSALEKLAGDLSATPEQLGAAVSRLAEKQLDAQRSAIERVATPDRKSLSPESTRSTGRPAPPSVDPPRVLVPRFPPEEAPTARRHPPQRPDRARSLPPTPPTPPPPPPPPRPARPPPPRTVHREAAVAEGHAVVVEAPVVAIEREPDLTPATEPMAVPEPIHRGASDAEPVAFEGNLQRPEIDRRRRRLFFVAGAVVIGAGALLLVALVGLRKGPADAPKETPAEPRQVAASTKTSAPASVAPEPSDSPPALESAESSERPKPARAAPTAPETPNRPAQKKPYRPRGI